MPKFTSMLSSLRVAGSRATQSSRFASVPAMLCSFSDGKIIPRGVASTRFTQSNNFSVSAQASSSTEEQDPVTPAFELPARETMEYDVVIVGAGPSGLASAIRLKQLAKSEGRELKVCIVEKGSEVGAHILSGNIFDTRALTELLPNWKELEAPLTTPVKKDRLLFLTKKFAIPLPIPGSLANTDQNYVISLGNLCRWMATQAEEMGVEIYPGFSASEILYDSDGGVRGIATADQGIGRDGAPKSSFARGIELRARQTLFAEGCRGSLSESLIDKFKLRAKCDPQTYAIGLKEVWQIDPSLFDSGLVIHTLGWPVPSGIMGELKTNNDGSYKQTLINTYGGAFLYHMEPNHVLVGFAVGLDYKDPYLSPYDEFQRFKTHPSISKYFKNGSCISYGARALNEGGFQSIPKLTFPGGALVGCAAGFLNSARLKGSHTAMKSGMLAAETIFDSMLKSLPKVGESTPVELDAQLPALELVEYETRMRASWIHSELYTFRNVHSAFKLGRYAGMIYSGFTTFITGGREFWTFRNRSGSKDSESTNLAKNYLPRKSPKPDGELCFDLLTNLQRSGTTHDDDQPSHLIVKPTMSSMPVESYKNFAAPEQRFCPARVYEFLPEIPQEPVSAVAAEHPPVKLQINYANCLHCKCCAIKTPGEYIKWTVPPGGQGPK